MEKEIIERFACLPLPTVDEVVSQAAEEAVLFPPMEQLTPDWIRLSRLYQYLFGLLFKERTGIDRLDDRIAKSGILAAPEEWKGFYQKYDSSGLRYYYLRCWARVERLSADEKAALEKVYEDGTEEAWDQAYQMVESSFFLVMTVSPNEPDSLFEPKPTIHGDYRVRGCEIPLVLRSVPSLTDTGEFLSEDGEQHRVRTMDSIWRQMDKALSNDLGCLTKTAFELFEVGELPK